MATKKRKLIAVIAILGASSIGIGSYILRQKIRRGVPEFVRMHGLRKSIRYLKGYDVYDEIYNEIGI